MHKQVLQERVKLQAINWRQNASKLQLVKYINSTQQTLTVKKTGENKLKRSHNHTCAPKIIAQLIRQKYNPG